MECRTCNYVETGTASPAPARITSIMSVETQHNLKLLRDVKSVLQSNNDRDELPFGLEQSTITRCCFGVLIYYIGFLKFQQCGYTQTKLIANLACLKYLSALLVCSGVNIDVQTIQLDFGTHCVHLNCIWELPLPLNAASVSVRLLHSGILIQPP